MQGEPAVAAKYKISLTILNNEIMEADYKSHNILPIVMEGDTKVDHDNKCRTYCERVIQLQKKHGQSFYMIRGQIMQLLLDNIKHDPYWDITSESYNPLNLLKLI